MTLLVVFLAAWLAAAALAARRCRRASARAQETDAWNTCPLHGHYVARERGEGPLRDCPSCATCDRLLVGRGTDQWDPLCALPFGHGGPCSEVRQ